MLFENKNIVNQNTTDDVYEILNSTEEKKEDVASEILPDPNMT